MRGKLADSANVPIRGGAWGALAGLRVLDLTRALAGPYCTQILGDQGAEILKVEAIDAGDFTRQGGPFHPDDAAEHDSGYYHSVNRNKSSIAIDLKSEAGRAIILRLVETCDVVVENFTVGTMDRLGLSYEILRERNPRLVYGAIRGFGDPRTGASPYANWPAYDVVAQAMGGISGITGPDASHPTKIGPGVGDTIPGTFLAVGILAAIYHRERTGKGQFVDVSMVDAIFSISERIAHQYSFGQIVAGPVGNHQPLIAPFGFFPTKDGHVAIAAPTDNFFAKLCTLLGKPELLDDPRFATMTDRYNVRLEIIHEISELTQDYTKAELLALLGGHVPFGPVYTMAEIAADEHFQARDMLPEIKVPSVSVPLRIAGTPIKMTETPGGVVSCAPELGQNTFNILAEAGYSSDEIAQMSNAGIIKDGRRKEASENKIMRVGLN